MLKKTLIAGLVAVGITPIAALWPAPKELTTGTQTLFIDPAVNFTYNGKAVNLSSPGSSCVASAVFTNVGTPGQTSSKSDCTIPHGQLPNSTIIIQGGISRAVTALFKNNFVPWKLRERGSNFEPALNASRRNIIKLVEITQTKKDTTFKPADGSVDESYQLDVSKTGKVTLKAASSYGVLHGLESFAQLFFQHSSGKHWYTPSAPITITDEPKFPHRGMLFDVARNWFEVDDIKRTIDGLAMSKMNRLHLHITDSQSWPLEIPAFPHLAEKGAYHKGLTYSPADLDSIYYYGLARGVEVIMEIDMPGHIGVVQLAYDNLITAYDAKSYDFWCAEPPCGAFRLNSTDVYDFLGKLLDDILPRISPYTQYFHTGGDELNVQDYKIDPTVKSNSTKVIKPLLQKFIDYAHKKIRKEGLTPFVWEEMATDWSLDLGSDVVVQSWLGGSAVKDLAEKGHKVIDSNYNYWYLDCGRGEWLNFDNGPAFEQGFPFNDWCGPLKSWRAIYANDPLAGVAKDKQKNVLGGEVAVWSETIDAMNMDVVMWPRASSAGEVLWSGRQDSSGKNRSQYEAVGRIAEFRERMVARGFRPEPVQMIFCTQGNATECAQLASNDDDDSGSSTKDSQAARLGMVGSGLIGAIVCLVMFVVMMTI